MAAARVIPVAVFETRALGKPCGLIRLAVLVADTVGEPSGGAIIAWPIAGTGVIDTAALVASSMYTYHVSCVSHEGTEGQHGADAVLQEKVEGKLWPIVLKK